MPAIAPRGRIFHPSQFLSPLSALRTAHVALRGRAIALLLAALVASAPPAFAQAAHTEGRVLDPDGLPVPYATVVVLGARTAPRAAETDEAGRFEFAGLPEGRYDITASAPGLYGELRGVTVGAATAGLDVPLRLSAIREALVVSAAQIDQPLSRTPNSVTVISDAEIEARQLSSLGAALRSVPGFAVAQNGGPGTLTSVFPRGGESDFTLVLIDGVRANAFGGGLDLSQVPLEDVERIEVVRGPQSALYGSDAIGGVVQIVTRAGGRPSVQARLEGGSRETRRGAASTSGSAGSLRWQGGGDYFEDAGFTGTAPASGQQVSNDDAREAQAWAGLGWHFPRGTDLQGAFRYVDTERGAPGAFGSDPAHRFTGVDRVSRGETARRAGSFRVVHPWFGAASRVRQRVEVDVADYAFSFLSRFGLSESRTRRTHGRLQTDAALDGGVGVSAGIEYLGERGTSTFITAGAAAVPIERRVIGTFGEARWNGHERLSVTAGVRAEYIRREALAGNPSPFSPRPEFPADTVVSVNPKVAASWLLTARTLTAGARAWTRLRAAAGTGIRPPDAFEIAFTDNPDLKPERSRSVEAGLTQALAGGAVQLDATVFFNQYDDLIVSVGSSLRDASRYRTGNISNARARGVELSGAWRHRGGVETRASYTFLDADVRAVDGVAGQAPPPYRVGDRLLRRPKHQASFDLSWTHARLVGFGSVAARGETLDAEPAFGPSGGLYDNPGRVVADVGGSVRLVRGLHLYARALNLFDRAYEEVLGFPAPGRTLFAGVRVAAGR